MKKRLLLRMINVWPPFLGAGIRVKPFGPHAIDVEMKLRRWNRNYVGTHFGGSLYSMTDPFFMLMLMENLGSEYLVWDKAATIRFKKPGRGTVRAEFRLSEEQIEDIRRAAAQNGKTEPTFTVQVKDDAGDVVAEVEKVLWVRRKRDPGLTSTPASSPPSA
jgi:acyl-coenzyme A thioesterase PaaI-like protein